MNEDDSPFYLAVNNNLKAGSLQTKKWFKAGPVGINNLAFRRRCTSPSQGATARKAESSAQLTANCLASQL